jgi:ribosome-associated translation inhibitor RaiA
MYTIRLRINDKIYKNLMWFLQRFSKEEIQVIEENNEFISVQQYLKKELASVEEGSAEYISLDELDRELESAIRKHED